MNVYLVEKILDDKLFQGLEPVAICKSLEEAKRIRDWRLITKIEIGKKYRKGIGCCQHWHRNEDNE